MALLPDDRINSFACALRAARLSCDWSQQRVALELGIQQPVYSKWESGRIRVPRQHVEKLRRILKLSEGIVADYLIDTVRARTYFSASYAELRRSGMSEEEIFGAVDEILGEFPPADIDSPDQGSNDFGDESKWLQFIREFPESFRMIRRTDTKECVAYWHVASLNKELYERGRDGQNINLELEDLHIREFIAPGEHSLYFIDLFRKSLHNNPAVNRELLESFLLFLRDLSLSGHFIDRILAHASTPEAERICLEIGFSFVCNHRFHRRYLQAGSSQLVPTKVYELNVAACFDRLMAMNPELLGRYISHYRAKSVGED